MKWIMLTAALVLAAVSPHAQTAPTAPTQAQLEANKKLLLDFFASQGTREEQSKRFQAEDYIQHNPRALRMDEITGAKGRHAWVAAFEESREARDPARGAGRDSAAQPGHHHGRRRSRHRHLQGHAARSGRQDANLRSVRFRDRRIKDGKFVEHWDQVTLAPGWMKSKP